MYISENCNWTPYGTNPELDKQVDSDDYSIRAKVAKQGYGLDKLVNDKDFHVRYEVAKQGYGLDKLINDKDFDVRMTIAKQGYGLDKLINDEDYWIRMEVAYKGYGLDILINDENKHVRIEVAKHGYGLDKLIEDKESWVRKEAKCYLKDHNLSLKQWVKQNPDKCIYKHNDSLIIEEVTKEFIYKIDASNKLEVQTQYDSIDEFFDSDVEDDIKMNTLIIYSIDTKIPLFKIEQIKVNEETNYKFIIDITNENDNFSIKSIIQTQEQLNKLIEQTVDALNSYPQFVKYADDLANCL